MMIFSDRMMLFPNGKVPTNYTCRVHIPNVPEQQTVGCRSAFGAIFAERERERERERVATKFPLKNFYYLQAGHCKMQCPAWNVYT